MKVLKKGDIEIGAFMFQDRRKPVLGIMIGNEIISFGTFHNKGCAEDFMNELAEFVGAEPESEVNYDEI